MFLTVRKKEGWQRVPKVISVMDNTQMKGVSHGKASEGSSAQHRSHSPNNGSYDQDGYPGDRVSWVSWDIYKWVLKYC